MPEGGEPYSYINNYII